MTSRRGTSNTAIRGNAAQRRASKRALLVRDGDGEKAPCWECGTMVTFETMVRDKIKCGRDGGRYTLGNLRVHCRRCSELQGHRMGLETRRWRAWKKRGLRKSRVGPHGLTWPATWYVHLGGQFVGLVWRDQDRTWHASTTLAAETAPDLFALQGEYQTMREALYALLVECTTTPRRKAA